MEEERSQVTDVTSIVVVVSDCVCFGALMLLVETRRTPSLLTSLSTYPNGSPAERVEKENQGQLRFPDEGRDAAANMPDLQQHYSTECQQIKSKRQT